MASALESVWLYLITHFSEFQLATVGTFIIHEAVFFLSGLPSIYFEKSGLFSEYKIQKKSNTSEAQVKCIYRLILYHIGVNLPVMLVSYPIFRWMGLRSSLPLPHWSVVVSQIIFYFILEDFVFYWGHRVLHTKWLYKHVHSVHHEYATPFGLTSEYAHPAEILFLGFATVVGPALTGPHLLTLWLWVALRIMETVDAHSGYDFPWSPSNFLPLYGGADFHDYHHRVLYTKSGNYSSTFVYMDWCKMDIIFLRASVIDKMMDLLYQNQHRFHCSDSSFFASLLYSMQIRGQREPGYMILEEASTFIC